MKKLAILGAAVLLASSLTITVLAAADTTTPATDVQAQTSTDAKAKTGRGGHKSKTSSKANVISVAASVLGKTTDEIKEAVKTGKVGDLLIAADKVDEFKAAYLTETKTKLDAAVTAGTLTQAEADEKYAEAETKMADYDGTQHLCGGTDHTKMFERKEKSTTENADAI